MNVTETDDASPPVRRRPKHGGRWGYGSLIAIAAVAGTGLVLWSQRQPIADNLIAREFAARKVPASYRLVQIGARTQRIENLVLGDPAHPDLTAKAIEVDLGYDWLVPRVVAVRAEGVRLHGRWADGKISLGAIDHFLTPDSSEPFALPDMALQLRDARARIDTPAGTLGLSMQGQGNLSDGFTGKLAGVMRGARLGGCATPELTGYLDIGVKGGAPRLVGPVRAGSLACQNGQAAATQALLRLDARAAPNLEQFSGALDLRAQAGRGMGALLADPRARLSFAGSAQEMAGRYELALSALGIGSARLGDARAQGQWSWKQPGGQQGRDIPRLSVQGYAAVGNLGLLSHARLQQWTGALRDTPVGPLAAQLADALHNVAEQGQLRAAYAMEQQGDAGRFTLSALQASGTRGAKVGLSEDGRFAYAWPSGRWTFTGSAISEGGGLPRMALRLSPSAQGGAAGQLFMDPYTAKGARLALEPVRFAVAGDGGWSLNAQLSLDGPLPGGRVQGAQIPLRIEGRKGLVRINPGCSPLRVAGLAMGNLRLKPLATRLCPTAGPALLSTGPSGLRGGLAAKGLALAGQLGTSPLRLRTAEARWGLEDGRFRLTRPELVLGGGADPVRLSAALFDGGMPGGRLGGKAGGVKARIGTVPVLVDDGTVQWSFARDVLRVGGPITVIDDARPDRFNPLVSNDFALTLANGRIEAGGTLTLPRGSAPIARVAVRHELASASGVADIKVDSLTFTNGMQPEDITRLVLGVVANVQGTVTGWGRIVWNDKAVTSTGEFGTERADLAAAFGPVNGLATRVRFTDLLGLVSAPGQEATIASINPGIEVREGKVRFALLPNQRVVVNEGKWPFAGGELTLLPTVMNFSADHPRTLTFRVVGLDAGSFINTLELENISATGTFDGLMPMIFDQQGGRIVGGLLVARQQGQAPLILDSTERLVVPCDRTRLGGTLSYVGKVSNENLGKMGRLAFDALKDLQFKCLSVWMDGALDGEVVTQVAFNGVNRGELSSMPANISKQFTGLPFIFNVNISAPFRGLINTARSFVDPGQLIRSHLGDQYGVVKRNGLAVQPGESDTGAKGSRK